MSHSQMTEIPIGNPGEGVSVAMRRLTSFDKTTFDLNKPGFGVIVTNITKEQAWDLIDALRDFAGDRPKPTTADLVRALEPGTAFRLGSRAGIRVRLEGDDYLSASTKDTLPIGGLDHLVEDVEVVK